MSYLSKLSDQLNPENALKYIAQDHYEKFHMKFIKLAWSVRSKASGTKVVVIRYSTKHVS